MNLFKRNGQDLYLIRKSPYGKTKNKLIQQLVKEYDEEKTIPYETGKYLEALFHNSEDYILGIHRTGFSHMTNEMILQVFNNGLKNLGDRMQGALSHSNKNIEKIVSFIDFFPLLIGQIKNASHYKTSTGVFVIKIPKSYLGEKAGEIKPIYFRDKETMYLLPEFICGYIPVNDTTVGNFVTNPNYTDFHYYKNDGLEYDIRVERKVIDLPKPNNNLM